MISLLMDDWWGNLSGAQQAFWGIALVFSVLFIIQIILSLIGFDTEPETEMELRPEVRTTGAYPQLTPDFTLFSARSIIAFFVFFGWAGVLILGSMHKVWPAIGFAIVAGIIATLLVSWLTYRWEKKVQSQAPNLKRAEYTNAQVHLAIPAYRNGAGKVHIQLQGSLRELDAITEGETLQAGTRVKVIKVLEDNVLLVEPVQNLLEELR